LPAEEIDERAVEALKETGVDLSLPEVKASIEDLLVDEEDLFVHEFFEGYFLTTIRSRMKR